MKAEELRIGNYVSNPPLSECRRIDCLDIRDHAEGRLIQPFEPVPLTEEWLLRFGAVKFENAKIKWRLHSGNKGITLEQLPSGFWWSTTISRRLLISYVHQLQNLYFALTSEELTLKEK